MKRLHLKVSEKGDNNRGKVFHFQTKRPKRGVHIDFVRIAVVFLSSATIKYSRVNKNGGYIALSCPNK